MPHVSTPEGLAKHSPNVATSLLRGWYVVHAKPAGEAIAERNLERQGYEVYCPRLWRLSRSGGRLVERIAPLFPRYLFLRLHEGLQALAPVRSTLGVAGLVRFGCEYARAANEVVAELRSRADPDTGLHRLQPRPLVPGTLVRILEGAFEDLEGIFQCSKDEGRAVILLRLLGREAAICVPRISIMPKEEYGFGCA